MKYMWVVYRTVTVLANVNINIWEVPVLSCPVLS